jgi:hypothetical protein
MRQKNPRAQFQTFRAAKHFAARVRLDGNTQQRQCQGRQQSETAASDGACDVWLNPANKPVFGAKNGEQRLRIGLRPRSALIDFAENLRIANPSTSD